MTPVWVSAWGDFDNDGRLDFLLSGQAIAARVYRNLGPATNTPPGAPTLSVNAAIVTGSNNVELRWNPASDAPTTNGAGLTYNVRVGTAPGLGNIVAPQAAATGFRRVPALGNAQSGTNFLLHNLAPGTYHWSVQAVDASFAGGTFSTNSSFTIAGLPLATTLAASDAQPAGAHLFGQVNPKGGPTTAWFEWGPTTNYGNVTAAQALGASNVFLNVAATITNLTLQEAAYHYRVVASNSAAVARGADMSFVVQDLRPVIDFGDPQLLDPQVAFLYGYVQPNNTQVLGWIEWGTDTNAPARTRAAVILFGFGTAVHQEVVGGLTLSTTYFARLVVSNLAGLTFTAWKSFATPTPAPPTLWGVGADGITSTEARLFGQTDPQGFAGGVSFQWGATTNLGTVAGAFSFSSFTGTLEADWFLTGLAPNTEYYFHFTGTNLYGAVTSVVHSFRTLPPQPPRWISLAHHPPGPGRARPHPPSQRGRLLTARRRRIHE